ncbi:MAG TPA: nicotinate-nucleotide adenylyltransferase [Bacillota bacterium]|nr:nicotinate-nucleotide adenylyltransferase [Bacillota bacterium]HUM56895.1 nicotinate-nucleotide adenylyltransferase [Bacillota bacterium]
MKRIGVLGGTFDPIHLGHLSLARDAIFQAKLDKVIFVPAGKQPFKLWNDISSAAERMDMLRLAVLDEKDMEVSGVEIDSEEISYTYKTLRALRNKMDSGDKLYFITGTDTFLKLETWKEAEALLRENAFVVGVRPGYIKKEITAFKKHIEKVFYTEAIIINNIRLDISSTEIRKRVKNGEDISGMVKKEVERYIVKNDLYK